MTVRSGLRASAALPVLLTLAACFPWFPFPVPIGDGETTIVVENLSDQNWVISLSSDFPVQYAIGAGETGEVVAHAGTPTTIELQDTDCAAVAELEWDDSYAGIRIEADGTLAGLEEPPLGEPTTFVQYLECGIGPAAAAGEPLPGGSGTVFVVGGDGSLSALDVESATLSTVLEESFMEAEYAISPDATQVILTRWAEADGSPSLRLLTIGEDESTVLVEDAASPAWSPDGTSIAYVSADPFAGPATLHVLDVASGDSVRLAEDAGYPSWSPDGSRIAFVSPDPMRMGFADDEPAMLRVVNADGSGLETLTEVSPIGWAPRWSPEGNRLAYTVSLEEDDPFSPITGIGVYDFEAREPRTLASIDGGGLAEPAWSPDGTQVAFTATPAGLFDSSGSINVVPADGGELREVSAADNGYLTAPAWSPEGDWIISLRLGGAQVTADLVAVTPDGEREVVIATGVLLVLDWRAAP